MKVLTFYLLFENPGAKQISGLGVDRKMMFKKVI
jgi:hypothetical protein